MLSPVTPISGPSRPSSHLNPPFSSPIFRRGESVLSYSSSHIPHSTSSRSSTPFLSGNSRIRSGSVFSQEQFKKEEFARKRHESREKLRSSWDLLFEKYKNVEDDDEIDLVTGEIVKDRGKLRSLQPRPFGKSLEFDSEDEDSLVGGPENQDFESDEDELGDWGSRSGLDPQLPEWEHIPDARPQWTHEDDEDFLEFMMATERLNAQFDSEDNEKRADKSDELSDDKEDSSSVDLSPRSRGTRLLPVPTLASLFASDQESEEDELAVIKNGHDEMSRKIPAPQRPSEFETFCPPQQRKIRPRMIVEVVIPSLRRSNSLSLSTSRPTAGARPHRPIPASASAPLLTDLFTPPPDHSINTSGKSVPPVACTRAISQSVSFPSLGNKGKQRMAGERHGEQLDLSEQDPAHYFREVLRKRNGDPFQCDYCYKAGGDRRANAALCKGRTGVCAFTLERAASLTSAPDATTSRRRRTLSGSSDLSITGDLHKNEKPQVRTCKLCREADGERMKIAGDCKGRNWYKRCPYYGAGKDLCQAAFAGKQSQDMQKNIDAIPPSHNTLNKTPTGRPPVRSVSQVARVGSDENEAYAHPPPPSTGHKKESAKRRSQTAFPPSPPPSSSIPPPSPALTRSTPRFPRLSLPPSSPPRFDLFSPQSSKGADLTPSPSHSAKAVSPSGRRSAPGTVKHSLTASSASRVNQNVYQLTPPPSSDGVHSASPMSERNIAPLPRKSALRRRPSDAPEPRPSSSVKRTRFSLVPRSPLHLPSSSETDDDSDDELDLLTAYGSSPVVASTSARYAGSSSPLRSEWTVRAADLGIKLGVEHTGRLPSAMVKNLVPSMGGSRRPTLGSSTLSTHHFSLPSPPLSLASSSSKASPAAKASADGLGYKTGLMLPPPVPLSRLGRSTPKPESSRAESIGSSASSSAPIVFTSIPAVAARARARSRSMSMVPSSSAVTPRAMSRGADMKQVPQSAPTRKSRTMMDLQRAAREAGDDAGLEWGMDEETDDGGRMWREGSVAIY